MIHHRTKQEVFRLDMAKLLVLLLLIALLLYLSFCTAPQTTAVAPTLTDPTAGASLTAGPLTLSGTGEAGSTVQVLANGVVLGTAVVGSNGTWSFDTDLDAGDTEFTFVTLNSDGTLGLGSDPVAFSVAAMEPEIATPTFSLPADAIELGAFTLLGTGTPNSRVEIFQDGVSLGTADVDSDGNWTFALEFGEAGDYDLSVSGLDADGNAVASTDVAQLRVAGMDIAAPTFDLPEIPMIGPYTLTGTGTPGSTIEIVQNGTVLGTTIVADDGTWSFDLDWPNAGDYELTVNALDDNGAVAASANSQSFAVGGIDITAPTFELPDLPGIGAFTLTGTGTPGSLVEIIQNGVSLGTAEVGEDGTWSFDLEWPDAGDYDLTFNALDADGNVVATSSAQTVSIGAPEIAIPTFDLPELAGFAVGDDGVATGQLLLNGRSEPNATIEIYANGELIGTTTADADGNWTFDQEVTLPSGAFDLTVRSLDAAGELLAESEPVSVEIPELVVEGGPAPTLAALRSGVTSDEQVELTGTAVAGSEVEIVIAGEVVDTVTADAGGNWRSSFQLPAGGYTIVARSGGTNSPPLAFVVVDPAAAGTLQVSYASAAGSGGTDSGTSESTATLAATLPTIELILDASWSMTAGIGGVPRIDIARQTMIDIVSNVIPAEAPVALRAYGNIEGNYACRTDLMVPLGPLNQEEMVATIEGVEPLFNANTPIAASLAEVPNDLADAEGEIIVVLLTDGEETCEGDPAAAIADLVSQGIDVRVDIVGLDIADNALQAEFQRWAELGGGQYYNAADSSELVGALSQSLGVSYLVQDEAGEGVAVGIIGGPALQLPPGTYTIQIIAAPDVAIEPVTIGEGETVELTIE